MNKTGLAYHPKCLLHEPCGSVPETGERLTRVLERLRVNGILGNLVYFEPQPAADEDILRVHSRQHLDYVRDRSLNGYEADELVNPDSRVGSGTFESAVHAAGGVLEAARRVAEESLDNCFCLVRPPGHHCSHYPSGFCYFNNQAIAIRHLQEFSGVERVAVFDWDAHAGNGTMRLFYDDPSILTVSVHRNPESFFPGDGFPDQIGQGRGRGYCMNFPVAEGSGDGDYLRIMDEMVLPSFERFSPDFIFVACGLDSLVGDPLGGLNVSGECFAMMTRRLMDCARESCGGRVVMTLEGGYNMSSVPAAISGIIEAMLGRGVEFPCESAASPAVCAMLEDVRDALSDTPLFSH
jgi:acetoin utilization deacetylase AcuC-like enzyme